MAVANQEIAAPVRTTARDRSYALIFYPKRAMAALGIQGNKITRIKK